MTTTLGWGLDKMRARKSSFRRATANGFAAALFGLVAALTLSPSPAKAWWNDDWSLRKKITIDASASGANITDPIGTTPVLIRLHAGNFRFASAKDDGSDLRFVAGDDKTPLKHHVEKYDPLLAEALVWVSVPNVQAGAKTEIWLYSGNKKAASTGDAKGTYDPDTLLVYHFNERGTPSLDSSVWANNAQSVAQPADGSIIGTGLRLAGTTPLTLPASPSLAIPANGPFAWSIWLKPAALQPNAALYSRRDPATGNGLVVGLDNGAPFVEVTNAGTVQRSGAGASIAAGTWHNLAVTASNGQLTLSLDGAPYASVAASLPALNTMALIGGDTATSSVSPVATPSAAAQSDAPAVPAADGSAAPAQDAAAPVAVAAMAGFVGDVDELHIDKVARPAGFIKFAAIGQGPDTAKLIAFSGDEETASWLSGYFAVILKSVTLDGWVVIGILVIMAALSWVVMYDRVTYLNKQAAANARFMKSFRAAGADLTILDGEDTQTLRASSLYRIYHIGAEGNPSSLRAQWRTCAGLVGHLDRRDPCSTGQRRGQGDAKAQPLDGGVDDRDLRRTVPRPARHCGRRHDHVCGDRGLGRRQRQRDCAGHRRCSGGDCRRSRRRDPGAVWLQLPDLTHQGSDQRHPGVRRRVRHQDGGVLRRRASRSGRSSHGRGVTAVQIQSDSKPYDDINITPMLDLAYVLLVIFIIMTTATVQGQKVNLPKASAAPSLATQTTKAITVANDGKLFLDTIPVTLPELEQRLVQQKALTPSSRWCCAVTRPRNTRT